MKILKMILLSIVFSLSMSVMSQEPYSFSSNDVKDMVKKVPGQSIAKLIKGFPERPKFPIAYYKGKSYQTMRNSFGYWYRPKNSWIKYGDGSSRPCNFILHPSHKVIDTSSVESVEAIKKDVRKNCRNEYLNEVVSFPARLKKWEKNKVRYTKLRRKIWKLLNQSQQLYFLYPYLEKKS